MPTAPPPEVEISAELVAALVRAQHPRLLGDATPVLRGSGWDNELWALDGPWIARLPRRAVAVPLVRSEQRWLPGIAARLPVAVPAPVAVGAPSADYPWPWSIVRWIPGTPAEEAPAAHRDLPELGRALAGALARLHVPAPPEAPRNPVRATPLEERDAAVRDRLAALPEAVPDADRELLLRLWEDGLAAPPWQGLPHWTHGDLWAGNVLLDEAGRLAALLDFGDLSAGDPAVDLAAAWCVLGPSARAAFHSALPRDPRYDEATRRRGRAWAAAFASLATDLTDRADDGWDATGRATLAQLRGEPARP